VIFPNDDHLGKIFTLYTTVLIENKELTLAHIMPYSAIERSSGHWPNVVQWA
jgi:hypothetical protein